MIITENILLRYLSHKHRKERLNMSVLVPGTWLQFQSIIVFCAVVFFPVELSTSILPASRNNRCLLRVKYLKETLANFSCQPWHENNFILLNPIFEV